MWWRLGWQTEFGWQGRWTGDKADTQISDDRMGRQLERKTYFRQQVRQNGSKADGQTKRVGIKKSENYDSMDFAARKSRQR